jgi:hypothetical protein
MWSVSQIRRKSFVFLEEQRMDGISTGRWPLLALAASLFSAAGCAPRGGARFPAKHRLLEVPPGAQVEYLVRGEGEPMILIHGFGGSTQTWHGVLPELSRHFRVHAYNTLGVG